MDFPPNPEKVGRLSPNQQKRFEKNRIRQISARCIRQLSLNTGQQVKQVNETEQNDEVRYTLDYWNDQSSK